MPNSELIVIVQAASRAWGLRGVPKKIVVALCGRICAELVDRECPDHVRQARQQWRYRQAGGRRLCSSLPQEAPSEAKKEKVDDEMTVAEFSMRESVQTLVEDVIGEILLPSLEDPVTVVRWAAAKALGRVSNVLPSAAAVDVLAALTPDGDDGLRSLGSAHRLHGTSLAVAEMLRRLGSTALAFDSPESLESLLDKVARPAFECQGLAATRDAACFVLWAVARGVCDQEIVSRNLDMILRLLVRSRYWWRITSLDDELLSAEWNPSLTGNVRPLAQPGNKQSLRGFCFDGIALEGFSFPTALSCDCVDS
ncbi:hypothetical protein FOZ62_024041 [Perkinsus olseni]|uniref:Tubulin-folding cofactor D ARM repeats domain-containing protein n=2 Tax=Perkinsus olseni TaxID=32597 RepID=A0A7J6SZQ1_PEROL|nr:hypothetical protein FOZ62_024041 [Perkinsus olseni]